MIHALTVTNHLGESMRLELRNPEKSGLLVQSVDGLGPSKANINVTELATSDGALYNSSRVTQRNVVITLAMLFNPTIEDSRQKTYKYFPVKARVKLEVEADNRTAECYGYVESNEPDIFSETQTTQISIVCPDPYLYSSETVTNIFSGVESLFEFPFSNESLTENLLEFGNIRDSTVETIIYDGDANAGIIMTIHALGAAKNITVYNTETRETMRIDTTKIATLTGTGFVLGDDIIISTMKGNKYAQLLRGGAYTNIINCLDKNSDWFQLSKGPNVFAYTADEGQDNLEFKMEYQLVFEGV